MKPDCHFHKDVARHIRFMFRDIPEVQYREPIELTNGRLPKLADMLADCARLNGVSVQNSTPTLTDKWSEGKPSTYELTVNFPDYAEFSVQVLPRGTGS